MSVRLTMIPRDQQRLAELEEVIERGAVTFFEVGEALREIQKKDLHRGSHKSFEDYCEDRWGFTARRAYQMIECVVVRENLRTMVRTNCPSSLPSNERQIRELAALAAEQQRVVWGKVLKSAGDVKLITAKRIKEVASDVAKQQQKPPEPVTQPAAAPTSELFPAEKPRPVQQGPRLQPAATAEADDDPRPAVPEPSDHVGTALDLLKCSEKALGALQGNLANARREMNAIGVAAVDVEAIDSRIKEIFDEIKTSKSRLSRGTAATPEVVRDEAGHVVPDKPGLLAAFAERGQAKGMLYALKDLAAKAKAFCEGPGGQHAKWQSLQCHIDELRREIRFSMPFSVCVYCRAEDPACKACHGLGWVDEGSFDQSPREMRNAS